MDVGAGRAAAEPTGFVARVIEIWALLGGFVLLGIVLMVAWSATRGFVSAGGSLYARLVLGVGVRDLTGGFKCYRREALERLDLDAVRARGYMFQIETTYRVLRAGFEVVELPIFFTDRVAGTSKMNGRIVLEAIAGVPALRLAALAGRL